MELASSSAADRGYSVAERWEPVAPHRSTQLGDSRRQFHHAAQFATAAAISYLPPKPDDSHTNLGWLSDFRALFSREIPAAEPFRIGVRPAELALLVVPRNAGNVLMLDLNGCTIAGAMEWLRGRIGELGADPSRYTLNRHYEIPPHAVARGRPFDATDRTSYDEIARWFANGFATLSDLARRTPGSSEVRCWPHHFDVGTLIDAGSGRSIGVGLEPGDDYYDEPYFYVNMSPQPSADVVRFHQLGGDGSWHTQGWTGAVLPGSRLNEGMNQASQVREFLDSAIAAAREIVGSD